MWNQEEFRGRHAVVTGGSEGIGLDFCRVLCDAGCNVYFCSRNAAHGQAVAHSLGELGHYVQVDLTIPDQIKQFGAHVRNRIGRLDYLVNNAANDDRIAFKDVTAELCDGLWALNLRSYLLVAQTFLDMLLIGEGKSIVNVGTTNYMFGFEPFTLYNATKSGILGFTRSLARELGHAGIRVNMLSPGWVMTEKQLRKYVTEDDKKALLRDQSLEFLVEPKHVSPALMFLLSSASCAITGQNIVVDAGKFMQ